MSAQGWGRENSHLLHLTDVHLNPSVPMQYYCYKGCNLFKFHTESKAVGNLWGQLSKTQAHIAADKAFKIEQRLLKTDIQHKNYPKACFELVDLYMDIIYTWIELNQNSNCWGDGKTRDVFGSVRMLAGRARPRATCTDAWTESRAPAVSAADSRSSTPAGYLGKFQNPFNKAATTKKFASRLELLNPALKSF